MAGRRRAEATPSFGRLCPAMTALWPRNGVLLALSQRHHAAPELHGVAGVDLIVTREGELAVGADVVGRQVGRYGLDAVALAHQHGLDGGGNHHFSSWIEREGARMDPVHIRVLN